MGISGLGEEGEQIKQNKTTLIDPDNSIVITREKGVEEVEEDKWRWTES